MIHEMQVSSKYSDSAGKGWTWLVIATDCPISALEVQMAELRVTRMWSAGTIQSELVDNLTRGLVANLPGVCADGVMREIQLAAYPEGL